MFSGNSCHFFVNLSVLTHLGLRQMDRWESLEVNCSWDKSFMLMCLCELNFFTDIEVLSEVWNVDSPISNSSD